MTKNPNQFNGWEFVSTPKGNDRFEFSFYNPLRQNEPVQELTWSDFISLCKSKDSDFNTIFRQALNQATDKLGAYFWECLPVSGETLNSPFRFVVTKNEELKSMKQDFDSFIETFGGKFNISTGEPKVISFLTNSSAKDGILVCPSIYENKKVVHRSKNISEFTKHAPVEKQLELWQEIATQLSQEVAKNDGPRWLSTHGLGAGTRYLHVRIYNNPKYYSYSEYKNFDKNAPLPKNPNPQPSQQPQTAKKWYKPTNYPKTWITGVLIALFLAIFTLLLVREAKK